MKNCAESYAALRARPSNSTVVDGDGDRPAWPGAAASRASIISDVIPILMEGTMAKPTDIPTDLPVRAVGLSWFRKEDYPALLKIFTDADKMPRTWEEWLKGAEAMEKRVKAQRQIVERIYIDPDTFPDWCASQNVTVDRQGPP